MKDGICDRAERVRRFNRFYTKQLGLLSESYLKSPFSLSEARILYEVAAGGGKVTATDLRRELGLDAGYLSRLLGKFVDRKLIVKRSSGRDGRSSFIDLTEGGRKAFAALDDDSREDIVGMLSGLTEGGRRSLAAAMDAIEAILGTGADRSAPYILRPPRAGDFGWVVERHGALYAEEYGWNEEFEALVAEITAAFIRNFDAKRENCWIAERNRENVGSVFLVKADETTAKLRLLLVEPSARGLGLGSRLVEECIAFAKRAGYEKMVLWTNSLLLSARRIYEKEGFRMIKAEPHRSFGFDLVGETWELPLR